MRPEPQSKANRIEPLLRVTKFSKRYVQQRTLSRTEFTVSAFEDVNLTLFRGKTLALVGDGSEVAATILGSVAAALECEVDGNRPVSRSDVAKRLENLERRADYRQ